MKSKYIIEPELKEELHGFETFLQRVGFKRTEGAVYGLLVLATRPLTSDEIETTLHLSQGAVSSALKKLLHFGAVEVRNVQGSRTKLHTAKEDSLSIVATIFRKREQETIEEFKTTAKNILQKMKPSKNDSRMRRLKKLVDACEMAEAVINAVINLTGKAGIFNHQEIRKKLPKILELIEGGYAPLGQVANNLTGVFTTKLKEKLGWVQREEGGDSKGLKQ